LRSTAPIDPGLNPTLGPPVTAVEAMPPVIPRGLLSRLELPAFKVSDGPRRPADSELLSGEEAPILALGGIPVVFLIPELSLAA
jgi:hypothetical protein